jgi:hypothetical protein
MTRGILLMIWGDNARVNAALPRAIASVQMWHPELPYHVQHMPDKSDLRCKAQMFDLSPYDETLYLDVDTVVLGPLGFAFEKAKRFGIACCININPWARRYRALSDQDDAIEYDTGVLVFDKCSGRAADLFEAWEAGNDLDSSSCFFSADGVAQMPVNDQCAFAAAVETTGINPFILPVNWNFHPHWQKTVFGEIKIWHDYNPVPDGILHWNSVQMIPGAVLQCGQVTK